MAAVVVVPLLFLFSRILFSGLLPPFLDDFWVVFLPYQDAAMGTRFREMLFRFQPLALFLDKRVVDLVVVVGGAVTGADDGCDVDHDTVGVGDEGDH